MCYDKVGSMYTIKDQVIDALAGVVIAGLFLVMWCAGAIADLAIVGF